MHIKNNVVRRFAYITRPSMFEQEPVMASNLNTVKPLDAFDPIISAMAEKIRTASAVAAIPPAIKVHQIIVEPAPHATSMMPLLVGVTRRDHRIIEHFQVMNRPAPPKYGWQHSLRDHRQEAANA